MPRDAVPTPNCHPPRNKTQLYVGPLMKGFLSHPELLINCHPRGAGERYRPYLTQGSAQVGCTKLSVLGCTMGGAAPSCAPQQHLTKASTRAEL